MYDQIISIAFSVTADCIVFAYFLFVPFRSHFRYNYLKTALLVAVLIAITVIVSVLFLSSGMFWAKYNTVGILLWLLCAIFMFRLAIKGSSLEILFIVLMILNLYANMGVISKVFMNIFNVDSGGGLHYCILRIGILSSSVPFYWILLGKLYRQVLEFNVKFSFWRFIWIIPSLLYMIFYIKIIHDYWKYPIGVGTMDIVFVFLWAITTYVVFCVTLLMLIQSYKGIMAKQQAMLITTQLKMQEGQYKKLLENIENTTRLRHDWRHHLLSINSFLKNGLLVDLQNYLDTLDPVYMSTEELSVCKNHVVDIILQHYATIARQHGITITIVADIPIILTIADTDLCVIFGNLVENAVEACTVQRTEEKRIEIKAEIKGKQLALLVKNTYQHHIVFCDNVYFSTKHDGVGIGLASVEKIVKNNNGTMKIKWDEKYFKIYVLLDIG